MQTLRMARLMILSGGFSLLACGQLPIDQNQLTTDELGLSDAAQASLSGLGLSESGGSEDDARSSLHSRSDLYSQLSDASKIIIEKAKAALDGIKAEKEKICSHDSALRQAIGEQIKTIHDDQNLRKADKKAKIEALLTTQQTALEADRQVFQSCVASNQESLKVWDDKQNMIIQSCGIPKHRPGHKTRLAGEDRPFHDGLGQDDHRRGEAEGVRPSKGKRGKAGDRGGQHLEDDGLDAQAVLQGLETALNSEACAAAL